MSAADAPPGRLATKEAAPAPLSQGLFLDGRRQMVFNSPGVIGNLQSPKEHDASTNTIKMGDPECLFPPADSRLHRPRSFSSRRRAAARSLKKNTTPVPPIPKSRSATSCLTAALPPPTA